MCRPVRVKLLIIWTPWAKTHTVIVVPMLTISAGSGKHCRDVSFVLTIVPFFKLFSSEQTVADWSLVINTAFLTSSETTNTVGKTRTCSLNLFLKFEIQKSRQQRMENVKIWTALVMTLLCWDELLVSTACFDRTPLSASAAFGACCLVPARNELENWWARRVREQISTWVNPKLLEVSGVPHTLVPCISYLAVLTWYTSASKHAHHMQKGSLTIVLGI